MNDDDRIDEEYRERAARYHAKAERRAERWAERRAWRRQRRAERRTIRSGVGRYDPMGLWSGGERGPSDLTLRLRDMMKQVDEIAARVSAIETIASGTDARLAAEIDRLARGPAASMGR